MTFGDLAAQVDRVRRDNLSQADARLGGFQARDLARVTADMIAWQESGFSTDGMALPPVYSVVRLVASTIDQLDLTVDGETPPPWLRTPKRYGSALDLGDIVQWVVTSMALNGAAYLRCTRAGESWRLDAIHPGSVQPQVSTHGVVDIKYLLDGVEVPTVPAFMSAWQDGRSYILAIPYLTTPQYPAGCSPITVCRESIVGYFAVERQASTLLGQGTYSGGRLETDQDITAGTAERYQDRWIANRAEGKLPVLGAGLRYVNDIIPAKDAQWLESRQFNFQQVCAMYGVPVDYVGLALMGGSSSLSYANAQDNDRRFRRNCLEHFTSQIADALSTLTPLGRGGQEAQRVEFDYQKWEESGANADDATDPGQGI